MAQRERKADPGFERAATDGGHTRDKVAVSDPAAVPIQTDAESAGTPTAAAEAVASTKRQARTTAPPAPFAANHHGENDSGLWLTAGGLAALAAGGIIAGVISVTSL